MSDDGCEGTEEELWNSLASSALQSAGFEGAEDVDDGVAGEVDGEVMFEDADIVVRAMTAPEPPISDHGARSHPIVRKQMRKSPSNTRNSAIT